MKCDNPSTSKSAATVSGSGNRILSLMPLMTAKMVIMSSTATLEHVSSPALCH